MIISNTRLSSLHLLFLIFFSSNLISQNYDHWESVVYNDDEWNYIIPDQNTSNNWINSDFDDSSWNKDKGGFGYGDDDDNTILEKCQSVFIRKAFNIIDSRDIAYAVLHMDYDDAFVAYLNGVEISRSNIGSTGVRVAYNESANTFKEATMYSGGNAEMFLLDEEFIKANLKDGENILAIQVHNFGDNSSDMSSNAFLSVAVISNNENYRPTPSWFETPYSMSTHLPLIIIETNGQEIGNEDKITATMKVVNKTDGSLNSYTDQATGYNGYIGIEVRGQSSQMFPKKQFSIETRDIDGEDLEFPLLGMNPEEDWVLYAPYTDKSLLRNAFTFRLAQKLSNWQPDYKFCEVYLNGDYRGLYLLIEKIKREKIIKEMPINLINSVNPRIFVSNLNCFTI